MWIRVCIDNYCHSELVILEYVDYNYAPRGGLGTPFPLVHFYLLLYLFFTFSFLWPPCVADANIIFLSCGFFLLLSILFFRAYSQPSQIGCLPYFHTWCGLSANLGCRSETCCTRVTENTGHKKMPTICHLGNITQLCRAISSQLRHVSTIGKNLLNSNVSPHVLTIW